ncbi:SOS response-associated peptidase [Noviherbaspirillum aridicola]|nr:SOS response-associated peptidase [Noviherbaspirillum aridicola]
MPADDFEWYRVTPEVNKVAKSEDYFIRPL